MEPLKKIMKFEKKKKTREINTGQENDIHTRNGKVTRRYRHEER